MQQLHNIYVGIPAHNCSGDSPDCDLKFCWIKADPTFEGLKQVLYEPEDRIVIQPDDPTPVKSSQCIAEFQAAAATLDPELAFAAANISLNEGLVAVTGGKGSGKTALSLAIGERFRGVFDRQPDHCR